MKRGAFIFILLFFLQHLSFAQPADLRATDDSIHFRDITLDEALEMGKAEKKPVFFFGFASWCEHCKRMKEVIFKNPAVADFYNKHFVCLKQDLEKGEGFNLHDRFHVKSYPTYVFLDSTNTVLYQSEGEKSDSMVLALGKDALTPTLQFPYLKKEFEKDVTNSDKCIAYVYALRTAMLDASEPAKQHLATQTDAQLLNILNWRIIANGIMDINSREFQFVLSHQKEYGLIASPGRVERKIVNVADELLTPYVNGKDSAGYFSRRPLAESIHHPKVDSLLLKYDLTIYSQLGNWNEYKKVADKSAEICGWNNASLLKEIANNYQLHVNDSASLVKAAKWALRAYDLANENSLYMLSAKLYKKAGDRQSAVDMARKAKDIDIKYGWDHFDADALINELQK